MLELACGTGRILVPTLEKGIDIEGVDISGEMLNFCRQKLEEKYLSTTLYEMDMVDFDTGKQYRNIFIAGASFRLLDDLNQAMASLETIYRHLEPGGMFVCDLHNPVMDQRSHENNIWRLGPTAFNDKGERFWYWWCSEYDLLEQLELFRTKYELYKDERLVETVMAKGIYLRWYGKFEFKAMLEKVGFVNIDIEPASIISRHGNDLVYFAHKKK